MLKGGVVYKDIKEAFPIKRSLPHGHVAAVYGTAKNLGLDLIVHRKRSRVRDIALGAIVTRVYVYSENHVRGQVFLCMLAYYLEWHLRKSLSPLMFEDDDREGAKGKRSSPVQRAEVSESAKRKHRTKKTEQGFSFHSLSTLLEDLGTLSLNEVTLPRSPEHRLHICAESTALQQRVFELLDVQPGRFVPSTATG